MRAALRGRARLARGLGVLGLAMFVAATAKGDDSASLARYVSKDNLAVYVEFTGLDAHADAWRKTAAYGILNKTTCGEMFRDVLSQSIDGMLANAPEGKPTGGEFAAFVESMAKSGFAFAVNGKLGAETPATLLVVRDAPRASWTKALTMLARMGGRSETVTREDGRKVTFVRLNPESSWAWWFEKNDLIIALTRAEAVVEGVVEVLAGKRANAVDLPLRAELSKSTDGFEPVMISFADLSGLQPSHPALKMSGLKRVDSRWGFQGEALVSIVRIQAPSPRKGLLALIDQPTFKASGPFPVPAGVTDFTVISVDPLKLFDLTTGLAREVDGQSGPMIDQAVGVVAQLTGLRLREDILGRIGPGMTFFSTGERVTVPLSPYQSMAQWFLHLPKLTMVADVKDPKEFAKTLDTLATVANRQIAAQLQKIGKEGTVAFKPMTGDARGYELDVPLGVFPLPVGIRPTIRLGKAHVAFSTDAESAEQALASLAPGAKKPSAELKEDDSKENLIFLSISDPSEYLPELLANVPFFVQSLSMLTQRDPSSPLKGISLKIDRTRIPSPQALRKYLFPATVKMAVDDQGLTIMTRDSFPSVSAASATPMAVALLLPAVQAARSAAKRSQSMNNIKHMMLAYHNYHATNNVFPPAVISDGEGKPLLSWRVAILPFIDQEALYKEFHLDEPWDSAHNKTLIERMPNMYGSLGAPTKTPFSTYYQTFVGPGALNEKKGSKGSEIASITDGTSNTIAIVEAADAVIWTKPDDVAFDPEKPLPKFGGMGFPGGFNAGFCDGSVRFIKNSVNPDVLKALITKNGGEVISADSF